jgi:hypothetical protein
MFHASTTLDLKEGVSTTATFLFWPLDCQRTVHLILQILSPISERLKPYTKPPSSNRPSSKPPIMSGSGGFYKYRCKYFLSHNCPNWVYCNGHACANCLVRL